MKNSLLWKTKYFQIILKNIVSKVMDKIVFSSLIAFNGMSKDYLDHLHKEPNISTKF